MVHPPNGLPNHVTECNLLHQYTAHSLAESARECLSTLKHQNQNGIDVVGCIQLRGLVGCLVDAPLVNLSMRLSDDDDKNKIMSELPMICAVADIDTSYHNIILPTEVVNKLQTMPAFDVPKVCVMLQPIM